jgi:glycosyltransferase involved in cell wall biosynthesis
MLTLNHGRQDPSSRSSRATAGSVSVVIPLYNHAAYIGEAVSSVLAQGDVVGEVIIIDDGSTDDSAMIAQDLARQDSRIRFSSQTNQGAHATINTGLSQAKGEYLTVLNSDDVYLQNRLDRLVEALTIDEGADLAASAIGFIDSIGVSIDNKWYNDALNFYKLTHDFGIALINGNFLVTTSNFLFRRRLFEDIGPFSPMRYSHDLDFALRVAGRGRRLTFVDRPLLSYRMHRTNTINEDHTKVRCECAVATARFLHTLWQRPPNGQLSIDWRRAQQALDVVERHRLTRAVDLCLVYLRCHPSPSLEAGSILTDQEFRNVLIGCL